MSVEKVYKSDRSNPRVLIVSPEISALPPGMGNRADSVAAKAGGMADVSAGLVAALLELGADVHVALPHYRKLFHEDVNRLVNGTFREYKSKRLDTRIHLAEDRVFYYRSEIYGSRGEDTSRLALVFQREVINNILPTVDPDLIHCHDWMTGLIPAAARRLDIPCLLTVHNIHTYEMPLLRVEDVGIDAAEFWRHLYYTQMPGDYEETRRNNRVDLLASGIFAAHYMNTVSPRFLEELVNGWHDFVPQAVREQIRRKREAGCGFGILNAPSSRYNPSRDELIEVRYGARDHRKAKAANKRALQEALGLRQDGAAPLFYWPSRLDPSQKGCELLAHVLHDVVSAYEKEGLQVVFVADGPCQRCFHDIVREHGFRDRVAVADFEERLSHLAYAASDFVLMPSRFEPCGLPQMIGAKYGALPVVHDTGGLHDTVSHLDAAAGTGNGFVFETYDSGGLRWAIDQAMAYWRLSAEARTAQTARIMTEANNRFNHAVTAAQYFALYERMLTRPLTDPRRKEGSP